MRELDILLQRYLDNVYVASDADEKSAFQQLLTLSDPELAGYLLRDIPHDEVPIANVIARIVLGLGLAENTTLYRGFTRELLSRMDVDRIRSDGYSFAVEMLSPLPAPDFSRHPS